MVRRLMLLLGILGALAGTGFATLWAWRERRRRRRAARRAARQAARTAGRGSTPLPPVVIPVAKSPARTPAAALPAAAAEVASQASAGNEASPAAPAAEALPAAAALGASPTAPADGDGGDDLRAIRGIGAVAEERLHASGVTRWDQIASWSAGDVAAMAASLRVSPERVTREDWVGQAQALAASRLG